MYPQDKTYIRNDK